MTSSDASATPTTPLPTTPPALQSARALVAELVAHGVREVVLSPGSRSAPLAYAVAEAADSGALRLHVRIDERSAGFLALGLARGQEPGGVRPVAVVTTSGTAVANLHPALLEAHHGQVPVLALTADRPHELRGTGANQTTDQVNIFGSATRFAADVPAAAGLAHEAPALRALAARAIAAATGARSGNPGPVHLNLSYRDPLAPHPQEAPISAYSHADTHSADRVVAAAGVSRSIPLGNTVVVAADGAGQAARDLAESRAWPLLAECVSGAAGGPNLVWAHAQVLTHAAVAQDVQHVVVLGRPTLSRPVQRLLARPDVEVIVVAPGAAPWPDAANNAAVILPAVPANWLDRSAADRPDDAARLRLRQWREAGQHVHTAVVATLPTTDSAAITGPALAFTLWEVLTPADTLVIGSSSPVRDLDLVAPWTDPPRIIANRGLAGIDGMVSTATGVALSTTSLSHTGHTNDGAGDDGVVRALLGDLTFLHDAGGLLRAPGEPEPQLQIIVANDQGGTIFAGLEHGALAVGSTDRQRTFDRIFGTPHTVDIGALCAAYGVAHQRVDEIVGLANALATPDAGISVVEVVLDQADRRTAMAELTVAIRSALNSGS